MNQVTVPWLAAASPPWFKGVFVILIALAIPGFFLLMWLMSRSHKDKKKPPSDK